jgi:hypothetical protein
MHRLFITALLASVAIAPAYAGKKDKGDNILEQIQDQLEDKAFDRYEDKIERLEGRLEGAGDDERQRIENIIDSVTDKYEAKWGELPEEPPPPPEEPEPTVLFKDDFNRDQTAPGNGWAGTDASIDAGTLKLGGSSYAEAYKTLGLDGMRYTSFTVTYDVHPNEGSQAHHNLQLFWTEGDASPAGDRIVATTESLYETGPHSSTWTTPVNSEGYDAFSFGFKTNGSVWLDNVVVTGVLWEEPTGDFVGF